MTYGKNFKRMAKLKDCGISTSKNRSPIIMEVMDERGLKVAEYVDGVAPSKDEKNKFISKTSLPYGFVREDHVSKR